MIAYKLELAKFVSALDNNGGSTYTKEFTLYYGDDWNPMALEGGFTVGGVSLPKLGDTLEGTGGGGALAFVASKISPSVFDPIAKIGTITVTYTLDELEVLNGNRDTVSCDDVQMTREVVFDFDDKPLLNTAGQIYATNAQVPFSLRSITIQGLRTSKKLGPNSRWKIVNSNSVNIDGETFDAGTLWLTNRHCETVFVNGGKQYAHSWTVLVNPDKHDLIVPNLGTVQKKDGKIQPIFVEGVKIQQPWPLDENGKALEPGYSPEDVYDNRNEYTITEEYNFGSFGWHF